MTEGSDTIASVLLAHLRRGSEGLELHGDWKTALGSEISQQLLAEPASLTALTKGLADGLSELARNGHLRAASELRAFIDGLLAVARGVGRREETRRKNGRGMLGATSQSVKQAATEPTATQTRAGPLARFTMKLP
ncbi:MAG: hypothetical protein IT384_26510 [Deltaproteobacteria bacterium]|nr:hypothetical protein [Deltaproteobacteria bacterium]